ncbi:MAG: peptidylprolyl isomerase [Candidatus Omnitrophota bacterium]
MKRFLMVLSILALCAGTAQAVKKEDPMAVEEGKTVVMNYTLTVDNEVVDTSEGKEPLSYVQGEGQIIPGLEKALEGLAEGDTKQVSVAAEEGYGPVNEELMQEVSKDFFPEDMEVKPGMMVPIKTKDGKTFPATVAQIKDETVKLNFNHPLAGKDLNFDVTIVEVK